jgi:hypothetical protein
MSPNGGYLDPKGGINVEMEYHYSHLLHQPEYSHLDDIIRKHKLQMLYVFFKNFANLVYCRTRV